MATLMRFRTLFVTSNFSSIKNFSNILTPTALNLECGTLDPNWSSVALPEFSDLEKTQSEHREYIFKEFIEECGIERVIASKRAKEKRLIFSKKISTLADENVLVSCENLVDKLLDHLQPFPFKKDRMFQNQNLGNLTIRQVRNEIENHYLAWRYNIDVKCIQELFHRFYPATYNLRSLRTMKRNTEKIDNWAGKNLSVAEKIYYINQIPFSVKYIKAFERVLEDLGITLFPPQYPNLATNSHQTILLIYLKLKSMNFSSKQIKEGLPILHIPFKTIVQRLDALLNNPATMKFKNEDKFLLLLFYHTKKLQELVFLPNTSLAELIEIPSIKLAERGRKYVSAYSILYHINQYFKVDSKCIEILRKQPQHRYVSELQLLETLAYLKKLNFTSKEVEESVPIVLYPWEYISNSLKKIESEAKYLEKYEFQKGCLPKNTDFFKNGTKQKERILQLCLYYLEKPFNFTGEGVWRVKEESEQNQSVSDMS